MRLFYVWNSKNDDHADIPSPELNPESGTPPEFADDIQPGQAVWANYATSYGVTDNLRLGINGYYLEQISNHQIDGHDIPNSRERLLAVGPGMMYIAKSKKNLYWFNVYNEVLSKNRAKGQMFLLRWLHVF
jgi:anthranilate 1,2-dioxygenase (deaminating, decarboxylating) large subunit